MPPILVPCSTKRIATQILVVAKLNGRKDLFLCVYEMVFSQQTIACSKLANEAQEQGVKTVQMKTIERHQERRSGVFILKCEHVSHFALIADFKQTTSQGP